MTVLRYQRSALRGDYIRTGIGIAVCALGVALAWGATVVVAIFAVAGLFFLIFGLRTMVRHRTEIHLTDDGIRRSIALGGTPEGGWVRALAWTDLRGLRLRYYSTRRDRSGGWMQLTLLGGQGRLSLDSTVEGFDRIVRAAAEAARNNDVALNSTTMTNMTALGVRLGPESTTWRGTGNGRGTQPDDRPDPD